MRGREVVEMRGEAMRRKEQRDCRGKEGCGSKRSEGWRTVVSESDVTNLF